MRKIPIPSLTEQSPKQICLQHFQDKTSKDSSSCECPGMLLMNLISQNSEHSVNSLQINGDTFKSLCQ